MRAMPATGSAWWGLTRFSPRFANGPRPSASISARDGTRGHLSIIASNRANAQAVTTNAVRTKPSVPSGRSCLITATPDRP